MERIDGPLLTRFLRGACSAEERRRVEEWMRGHPERRRHVQELERLWRAGAAPRLDAPDPDCYVDADWMRLREKMRIPRSVVDERTKDAPARRKKPVLRRARLRRAVRTRRTRFPARSLLLVAGVLLVAFGAALFLFERLERPEAVPVAQSNAPSLRTAATRPGEWARLTLSDGTHVRLNVGSKIRYPQVFAGVRREVYLSGEAYFEVAEDAAHPFIVHAGGAVVRVHGTKFDVRAYAENEVTVVVAEGKVSLHAAGRVGTGRDEVALTRRTVGRFEAGRVEKVAAGVNLERQLAWLEGQLIFEDTPMRIVAAELERWYDLKVHIDEPELVERRLTATFDNEPLEVVLEVIAAALEATYERDGVQVTFHIENEDEVALE